MVDADGTIPLGMEIKDRHDFFLVIVGVVGVVVVVVELASPS